MTHESFPLERTDGIQVFPSPRDGACVPENPPALIWLPLPSDKKDSVLYRCTVTDEAGKVVFACETVLQFEIPVSIITTTAIATMYDSIEKKSPGFYDNIKKLIDVF